MNPNDLHFPTYHQFDEQQAPTPTGWFVGNAGAARVQRLVAFLNQNDEPSRAFWHRLCTMPCGIGAFSIAGGDATRANVAAARLLELLAPRLSLDQLIEMLQSSNAPSELVQAMDAPLVTMLHVAVRRDDVPEIERLFSLDNNVRLDDLLLLAVHSGSSGAVRLFIDRGAVVTDSLLTESLEPHSGTRLSPDVVRLLVGARADKRIALTYNQVYRVVSAGVDLCRVLISADTEAAVVQNCLNVAADYHHADIIAHCLDLGASLDASVVARSVGHSVACFRVFQSRNLIDASVLSQALKYSLSLGGADCFTLLLEAGAAVDDPELPVFAARYASPAVVRRLIEAGTSFRGLLLHSIWSDHGSRANDFVLSHQNRQNSATFEALLAAGADASALDEDAHSVLFAMLDPIFFALVDVRHVAALLAAAPEVPDADAVIADVNARVQACAEESSRYGLGVEEALVHGGSARRVCATLLAGGWDDPALVAGAGAVDLEPDRILIETIRKQLIRPRITQICIALQALELPALILLALVDAAITAAPWASMHWKWKVITTIKHKLK
jgi:hypothetical protein